MRISGLNVGRVKTRELERTGTTRSSRSSSSDEYAPIPKDTRALLRQKSLLGQIYVELTPGHPGIGRSARRRHDPRQRRWWSRSSSTRSSAPSTARRGGNFQAWVRELSTAIDRQRGEDLNDALGNLPRVRRQRRRPARDPRRPGAGAARPDPQRRHRPGRAQRRATASSAGWSCNANGFFGAVASRDEALAETIAILPTFLDESRLTVARLERFATDTRPLVRDLIPVAIELRPTRPRPGRARARPQAAVPRPRPADRRVRGHAPAGGALPARRRAALRGAARLPAGAQPDPVVPQLLPAAGGRLHLERRLRRSTPSCPACRARGRATTCASSASSNSRSVGLAQTRPDYDRGNAYVAPNYLQARAPGGRHRRGFDCKPAGRPRPEPPTARRRASCSRRRSGTGSMFPRLKRNDAPVKPPPEGNDGTRPPRP